ncbi:MAG: hypothetical protein H6704_05630 [Myxococcales bacterium]|nr:hypothetical protein [Myxococcales bacterium]
MIRARTLFTLALLGLALAACGGAPRAPADRFEVFALHPQYVGEERGEGETGDTVAYWDDAKRAAHVLRVRDGKLVDLEGRPLDPDIEAHPERGGFAMYAMTGDGTIYYSFDHRPGHVHHSTLTAGAPVACAGDMTVINGELVDVNNSSGHYRPPPRALDQMVLRLRELGVDMTDVEVKYWGQPDRAPPPAAP